MAPAVGKSAEPAHYKLHGVLYHHGDSDCSGHYTFDVLHPNGESSSREAWLHVDEAVSTVRHEDVFGGHENERVDDCCAYMLFYCCTAPACT
jgi:ubiquitin carboxyl-terminal hydrolase 10